VPDLHDTVTVVYLCINEAFAKERYTSHQTSAKSWKAFCQAAFIEENVSYRIDDNCVVHPFVDTEFAQNIAATLKGLSDPRLLAVKVEVERSLERLGGREPDLKAAVRSIFEAVEIYAKLSVSTCNVARLNRNIVMEHIVPRVEAQVGAETPAGTASRHVAEAICAWIAACHIYRHGQGVNEPSPPPTDLAVLLVSNGASYLRWLLDNTSLK